MLPLLLAGGCDGEPIDIEEREDAAIERAPERRPLRLGDPADIRRRAELALEARLDERPQDAVHREELLRWEQDQIRLDDMMEEAPLRNAYEYGAPTPVEDDAIEAWLVGDAADEADEARAFEGEEVVP